jgi:hypothetical protein
MNNEKRLAELEIELEAIRKQIREMELNDPCGDWNEFCMYMKPVWDKQAKLDREKRMLMTPEFDELPTYGHVMSLKEFIECVKDGCFIDYDGHGRYVRDGKESNIHIYPSDIKHKAVRKDFDTIIWFNK